MALDNMLIAAYYNYLQLAFFPLLKFLEARGAFLFISRAQYSAWHIVVAQ